MNLSSVPIEEHTDLVVRCPHCRYCFSCYEQPRLAGLYAGRAVPPAARSIPHGARDGPRGARGAVPPTGEGAPHGDRAAFIDGGEESPDAGGVTRDARNVPFVARDISVLPRGRIMARDARSVPLGGRNKPPKAADMWEPTRRVPCGARKISLCALDRLRDARNIPPRSIDIHEPRKILHGAREISFGAIDRLQGARSFPPCSIDMYEPRSIPHGATEIPLGAIDRLGDARNILPGAIDIHEPRNIQHGTIEISLDAIDRVDDASNVPPRSINAREPRSLPRGVRNLPACTRSMPLGPRSVSEAVVIDRNRPDPPSLLPPIHSANPLLGTLPRLSRNNGNATSMLEATRKVRGTSERRRERSVMERSRNLGAERVCVNVEVLQNVRQCSNGIVVEREIANAAGRRFVAADGRYGRVTDVKGLCGRPVHEPQSGVGLERDRCGGYERRSEADGTKDRSVDLCELAETPMETEATESGAVAPAIRQVSMSKSPADKSPLQGHSPVMLSMCPTLLRVGDGKVLSDVMKKAVAKLSSPEWDECVVGLHEIVYVAAVDPAVVRPHLKVVNRGQLRLLTSLRSSVARSACQATNRLFRTLRCTLRPEFDDIAGALLHRTADLNRFLRTDANEALDAMVTYVPAYHSVRVLCMCATHRNHLVRSTVARLLMCVTLIAQPENVVGPRANRETRKRVLRAAARFLTDANAETRTFARELLSVLLGNEECEAAMVADVEPKVYEQVERAVLRLKHGLLGTEAI